MEEQVQKRMMNLQAQLDKAKSDITTLRFWREQGLHEIKRLKDEVEGLRERLVANTEADVLKFKVSNLTTERDVANQEIERLKLEVDVLTQQETSWDTQLTTTNDKVKKLREALEEWKRQIEQVIRWGNAFLGEKFDLKMQNNLLAICDKALADAEDK